jgi:acyl-coenzyme A thioesterase PaaI-like protein
VVDPAWGEPRSRTITWYDPMQVAAAGPDDERAGAALGRARRRAALLRPISQLFQMGVDAVERGRVEFTCELDESAYNPIGVVHGGWCARCSTPSSGCAVHTTLPVGSGYTSIEIKSATCVRCTARAARSWPSARW